MDKKDKKLEYEKPKLENMSRERTKGNAQACENGSAALGDCVDGAAPSFNCTDGTGVVYP